MVLPCNQTKCAKSLHYHCPWCDVTKESKEKLESHISLCQTKITATLKKPQKDSMPAIKSRRTSKRNSIESQVDDEGHIDEKTSLLTKTSGGETFRSSNQGRTGRKSKQDGPSTTELKSKQDTSGGGRSEQDPSTESKSKPHTSTESKSEQDKSKQDTTTGGKSKKYTCTSFEGISKDSTAGDKSKQDTSNPPTDGVKSDSEVKEVSSSPTTSSQDILTIQFTDSSEEMPSDAEDSVELKPSIDDIAGEIESESSSATAASDMKENKTRRGKIVKQDPAALEEAEKNRLAAVARMKEELSEYYVSKICSVFSIVSSFQLAHKKCQF